jgi:phage-related protein
MDYTLELDLKVSVVFQQVKTSIAWRGEEINAVKARFSAFLVKIGEYRLHFKPLFSLPDF